MYVYICYTIKLLFVLHLGYFVLHISYVWVILPLYRRYVCIFINMLRNGNIYVYCGMLVYFKKYSPWLHSILVILS